MCFNGVMQRATWTSNGETFEVIATLDEDGDYDVRAVGDTDPYGNWTTYATELASGQVRMVFH